MPTTPLNSDQGSGSPFHPARHSGPWAASFGIVFACLLAGCAGSSRTTPIEFFQLKPESSANRAIQTRIFETRDSDEILSASAAVLQDLGFQITEVDRSLGFLRGAKERSAREYGQEISRSLVAFFSFALSALSLSNATTMIPVDLQQQINATLIAVPLASTTRGEAFRNEVRIVFYRLVWKSDGRFGNTYIPPGEQKMEMIRNAEIYQQFFARLSKSIFLEAQKI